MMVLTMAGPSGWTRTTTSRVKSPACCVHTTKGMERMAGFEPAPQGLEGPQATVTPHSLSLVVKDPALASLVGGNGFEPNCSPRGERGYGPSADHPLVPPDVTSRPDQSRRQTLPVT